MLKAETPAETRPEALKSYYTVRTGADSTGEGTKTLPGLALPQGSRPIHRKRLSGQYDPSRRTRRHQERACDYGPKGQIDHRPRWVVAFA
jgi:hypothetical protein